MLLHSFFLGFGLVFLDTASSTLFLAKFSVELLPYVYIGAAFVVMILGIGYAQLEARLSAPVLMSGTLGVLFISLLAFHLGLQFSDAGWIVLALMIWNEAVMVFTGIEFWGLAGRLFDVRQSKRLFGLIGAGGIVAGILGGFSIPLLVQIMHPRHLLAFAEAGLLLSLVVLMVILRTLGSYLEDGEDEDGEMETYSLGKLLKNRYLILIFLLSSLSVLGFFFIDYIFYQQIEARFPNETELAGFIGLFFAVSGVLQLILGTFFSGRLLSRYGQGFGLLILPLSLLGSMLLLAGSGLVSPMPLLLFWLIMGSKLLDTVIRPAFEEPSVLILYQPLPPERRLSSQTVVESIIEPIAGGVAGGAIILFTLMFPGRVGEFSLMMLFVLGAWLIVSVILRHRYTRELIRSLKRRTLSEGSLSLNDAASLAILNQALESSHPEDAVHALELLELQGTDNLGVFLCQALGHASHIVRKEALRRIERLKLEDTLDAVRQTFENETDPRLKGTALRTYCLLAQEHALEQAVPYLTHSEVEVRVGAIVGLLKNGGIEGVLAAGEHLLALRQSLQPQERVLAARILGEVGIHSFYQPLETLLMDINREVRLAAIKACKKVQHPKLWRLVADNLASPATRYTASEALAVGGGAVMPVLQGVFEEQRNQLGVQQRIIKICGTIGGQQAQAFLQTQLDFSEEKIQCEVLLALVACGYRAQGKDALAISARYLEEIARIAWLMAALNDIVQKDKFVLLPAAIHQLLVQKRKKLFAYLCFLYNTRAIKSAEYHLLGKNTEKQAYALETLDNLLSQEEKQYLFPLLETLEPSICLPLLQVGFPQAVKPLPERLSELLTNARSLWLQACVLYTIGKQKLTVCEKDVIRALSSPYPLLQETAAWAIAQLEPEGWQDLLLPLRGSVPIISHLLKTPSEKGTSVMRLTIEKVLILKSISIFSEIPDEALAEVAVMAKEIEFQSGDTIINKGEVGHTMYIVVDGQVAVKDGEQIIATLGQREVFGELAALDPEPRLASVVATENTVLFQLDDRALSELMADYPEVGRGIITILCRRLRKQTRKTQELIARV